MILLFFFAFAILFVLFEILQNYIFKEISWSRKATHIGVGFILFPMPYFLSGFEIIILASVLTVGMIISKYKHILSLHEVGRKTVGEILFPISIGILAILCLPANIVAFQAGCMALAFSDGLAAIVGNKWPIKEFWIFNNKKSLGGSMAFAASMSGILFFFPASYNINISVTITFLIIITLVEFLLVYGFDNLAVPILTALFYLFLQS